MTGVLTRAARRPLMEELESVPGDCVVGRGVLRTEVAERMEMSKRERMLAGYFY
jgi:hypothetical protein